MVGRWVPEGACTTERSSAEHDAPGSQRSAPDLGEFGGPPGSHTYAGSTGIGAAVTDANVPLVVWDLTSSTILLANRRMAELIGSPLEAGCDHLNRPHRDHLFWPHVARSEGGVHQSFDGGLEPGTHANEVEGGTVRGDPQGQCRRGQPVHP